MKGLFRNALRLVGIVAEGSVDFMIVVLVVMVFQSVVGRYFLRLSDIYTQELTQLIYPWIVFMGIAIAYREKSHLSVTFFTDLLPKGVKQYIEIGQTILTFVFFAFLLVAGYRLSVITADQITSTLAIRKTWFYMSVPIGAVFTLCYVLSRFVRQVKQLKHRAQI